MHILLCLGKVYNWGVCRFAHGHALPLGEMHFPFQILVFLLAIWCKSLVRMVAVKIGWKQWWTHEKWNKEEKGRTPYEKIKRTNTLGHVTKATWCGNFQEKCPDQNLGAHFALKKKRILIADQPWLMCLCLILSYAILNGTLLGYEWIYLYI